MTTDISRSDSQKSNGGCDDWWDLDDHHPTASRELFKFKSPSDRLCFIDENHREKILCNNSV